MGGASVLCERQVSGVVEGKHSETALHCIVLYSQWVGWHVQPAVRVRVRVRDTVMLEYIHR